MKRIFLIIASILLFIGVAYAKGVYLYAGKTVSGDSCSPRGTAALYYDVDHTSGDVTACIDGGTKTVTLVNAAKSNEQNHTTGGTDSIKHEAGAKEYYTIPISSKDVFDSAEGMATIWYYPTASTGTNYLLRIYIDASNAFYTTVNSANTISLTHIGQGSNVGLTSTDTFNDNAWNQIDIRWSATNNKLSIRINGGDWKDDTDGDAVTAFAEEPSTVTIGVSVANVADTHYTDDVLLYTSSGI